MYVQTGKTFIATLIAVVMALGGIAWLSSGIEAALGQHQGRVAPLCRPPRVVPSETSRMPAPRMPAR